MNKLLVIGFFSFLTIADGSCQIGLEFNKISRTKVDTKKRLETAQDTNPAMVKPGMTLLSNLGKTNALQPKIDLVANKRFDKGDTFYNFFAESKLFLGSHDNKERRALFIEEMATFSFYNSIGWKPFQDVKLKKAATINFNFSYQGKNFFINDSTESNPGVFHANVGLDFVLFTYFSLYGSYNFLQVMNGSNDFQRLAWNGEGLPESYHFYKIGFKATLDLLAQDQGNLDLNIGFVFNNSETKRFTNSNDKAFPVLELKFSSNIINK